MRPLKTKQVNETPVVTGKKTKPTLLGHIEKIVELSVDSKLNDEFFDKAKPHINFVKRRLHLNDIQAVILSHFIDMSADSHILLCEIAKTLKCRSVKLLQYWDDIEVLNTRKLIRQIKPRNGSVYFRVPREVIEAFTQNKDFQPAQHKNISLEELFDALEKLFDEREEGALTFDSLTAEITNLLEDNPHLEFTKLLQQYYLDENEKILFLFFCHLFVKDNDDNIGFHDFEDLFDSKSSSRYFKSILSEKRCKMMELDLLETNNADGFEDRESFKLTDKAKNELLGELNIKVNQAKNKKDLTLHGSLVSKQLFYNGKEQKQIVELTALLQEDNFRNIRNRMIEKGMRTGFACLFHGAPGTGKTETVYQIARQTGRDVFLIDIAQTKSMWFGESEKRIKEIFDRYKSFVKELEIAPILLFNEADAVINKREEIGKSSVGKTENAIQNIILQEMENLDGIMIATTNLTQNLDKAFERRFLYKIEFGKPSIDAKKSIWKANLSNISDEEANKLAGKFDFSGGQIENIARKATIDSIIGGSEPDFEKLAYYCESELLTKERPLIGFKTA